MRKFLTAFENYRACLPLRRYGYSSLALTGTSSSSGSSVGYSFSTQYAAIGEALERLYLYNEVVADGELSSEDANLDEMQYINHISSSTQKTFHKDEKIPFVKCVNIFSNTDFRLPAIFVGLDNNFNHPKDKEIFRDSCGSALGSTSSTAFEKALLEYIERQSLIEYWHKKRYRIDIPGDTIHSLLPDHLKNLYLDLERTGTIRLHITSNKIFNCHTGVMIYFCSKETKKVKYSISSAADFSIKSLVEKLLLELWQSYIYQAYESESGTALLDLYKGNFTNANNILTMKLFEGFAKDDLHYDFHRNFSTNDFINSLSSFTQKIYHYQRKIQDGFYFSKIISLDFFVHMNLLEFYDKNNKFAKHINLKRARNDPLPFP
jgi:hypothetical protein